MELLPINFNDLTLKDDYLALVKTAKAAIKAAKSFQVVDAASLQTGADKLKKVKNLIKDLAELKKKVTKPIKERLSEINTFFTEPEGCLEEAKEVFAKSIIEFQTAEEAKRLEAIKKLQAEADEAAEKEKLVLQKRAENALAKGQGKIAAQLIREAKTVTSVVVEVQETKVDGLSLGDKWEAVIEDVALVPREWMIPDQKALDSFANAQKGNAKIPGVKFVNKKYTISK